VPDHMTDALASIIARMVLEVIEADRRLLTWAIESGVTPAERCSCRARVANCACVCMVEPALPRAFMIRAAARLQAGKDPGYPPRRRCLLCLRGDHDLVETIPAKIVALDGRVGSMMVPGWRSRSKRYELDRATRAHAYPPGTRDSQRDAAGLMPNRRR
jgi:hypothetical protein